MKPPFVSNIAQFFAALFFILLAAGCGVGGGPTSPKGQGAQGDSPAGGDADGGDADGGDLGGSFDPFAPQPDQSEGLVNVSGNLEALLEGGDLAGACDAYNVDPQDRRKKLLCGKYMFFYETFGTAGVPAAVVDFLTANFPDQVGAGFAKMGLIADPYSAEARPLGMAPGEPFGSQPTLAYTCASCHFGQLPDGRYAVGQANLRFDYGKQILAMTLLPMLLNPLEDMDSHHPAAIADVQPLLDHMEANPGLRWSMLGDLLPLVLESLSGGGLVQMGYDAEGYHADWPPGTMDFLIPPAPIDDGVHTVSRTISLYGLPDAQELEDAGAVHAMLGWAGNTPSLMHFLDGFVVLGSAGQSGWPGYRLDPLQEFIFSLRAPANAHAPPADRHLAGRQAFLDAGCQDCHNGPRGGGLEVYTYEELGTDAAMARWGDPELTGELCCGLAETNDSPDASHGIKAPRLSGVWTLPGLLHNGTVQGLEELFCLTGPRPAAAPEPLSNAGHMHTCVDLTEQQKLEIIDYLKGI